MPFEKVREVLKKMCERHKNLTVIYGWNFVPHFSDFCEDGYLHLSVIGFFL